MKTRCLVICAMLLAARTAAAEPDQRSATELAVAQALFDEGRTALDEGRIDEACEKLSRSHRLDPAGGTLLNLALCHEKQGRLATAWTEYTEGLALARRDKHEVRIAFAEEHLAGIEGRLPRVRLAVRGDAADVVVRLDEVVLDRAALGIAIPLDPGRHVVTASAPGKITWKHELGVRAGERADLEIPELAIAPQKIEPDAEPVAKPKKGRRVAGWITAGVGGAAIVSGAAFGVIALTKNAKSKDLCPNDPCSDSEGAHLSDEANTFAWVANVTIGAGLVAVAVGTVLILTSAPSAKKPVALSASGISVSF